MDQSNDNERWLPIPGAEDFYEASNHGHIRSIERVVTCSNGQLRRYQGYILKPRPDDQGRLRVSLRAPGMPHDIRVSRLILMTFVGPPPEGMEGCHNDGNPSNNWPENLRWDTHEENCRDTVRHGRSYWKNKQCCPRNHLLVKPNLVATTDEHRTCLACSWAKSAIRSIFTWNRIKQTCPYSFQELADAYYAKIMGLPINPLVHLPRPHKERTNCIRGHRLIAPNLVPSALKKNKRICQSCQWALNERRNAKLRGQTVDVDVLADQYYSDLMPVE